MAEIKQFDQSAIAARLVAKVAQHGTLLSADETAIRGVRVRSRMVEAGEDIVSQGEKPDVAVFLLSGMLARYHTLATGDRQYLSLHIAGDMPDVQSLLLDVLDHSLCAMDRAVIALLPHNQLQDVCVRRPAVAFALWRLTLIDAAIFRQAINNNSARSHSARLAHLLCEQFYRAREERLTQDNSCSLPLNQTQLGQLLGMSLVSVNRAFQALRRRGLVDFRAGQLTVRKWAELSRLAAFDPTYLHVAKGGDVPTTPFRGRRV
jgi:CRP-like cAMP-binding protein